MSLYSAETSSCSRGGAWASRLRCLWTVQRWVGTSPHRAASACSSPDPPSTIRNSGLRSPRLTRSSRTARQAWLVSPPIFLTASSTFWPSSRTPSTARSTIEVALRSSLTRTTVPSRIKRTIGSSASERAFQASQSAFTFRHTRLTVIFADCTAKHCGQRPAHPTGVGAGKIGAGNQRIGLLGAPLVSPQRRALPFRGLALRGVEPRPRPRELPPAKGPQQRARSVTVPVAGDTAGAIVLGIRLGPASIARPCEHRLELTLDHRLDELAHPVAQTGLDRIKPLIEKPDRNLGVRTQNRQLRAIVRHGVVSTGAQRRDRLGFSTRRLRHLQFQPHSGRHRHVVRA